MKGQQLKADLEHDGIEIRAGSMAGLAEEAPIAYKDVSRVVEVVHNAGIANIVARLEANRGGEGVRVFSGLAIREVHPSAPC